MWAANWYRLGSGGTGQTVYISGEAAIATTRATVLIQASVMEANIAVTTPVYSVTAVSVESAIAPTTSRVNINA